MKRASLCNKAVAVLLAGTFVVLFGASAAWGVEKAVFAEDASMLRETALVLPEEPSDAKPSAMVKGAGLPGEGWAATGASERFAGGALAKTGDEMILLVRIVVALAVFAALLVCAAIVHRRRKGRR